MVGNIEGQTGHVTHDTATAATVILELGLAGFSSWQQIHKTNPTLLHLKTQVTKRRSLAAIKCMSTTPRLLSHNSLLVPEAICVPARQRRMRIALSMKSWILGCTQQ